MDKKREITEKEIEEYNNNNNNNIYIYNNISSISINTTTTIKNILSNKNYSSIIYLLLKKGFTYFGEIRRVFGITTNFHLNKLELLNIVYRRDPTKQELKFITSFNKTINIHHLKNSIFELTKGGYEYFTQPKNYDILKVFSISTIDEYIILQKNEFEKIQIENQRKIILKEELLEREFKLKYPEIYRQQEQDKIIKQTLKEIYENEE